MTDLSDTPANRNPFLAAALAVETVEHFPDRFLLELTLLMRSQYTPRDWEQRMSWSMAQIPAKWFVHRIAETPYGKPGWICELRARTAAHAAMPGLHAIGHSTTLPRAIIAAVLRARAR